MKNYSWLKPLNIVAFISIPVLIFSLLIPDAAYLSLFNSQKQIDVAFFLASLIILLFFMLGCNFSLSIHNKKSIYEISKITRYAGFAFILTMIGYLSWIIIGVYRAGGLSSLVSMILLLLEGDKSIASYLKFTIFDTLPGLTTFTQFGIVYITLESYNFALRKNHRIKLFLRIIIVFLFAFFRSIILSERLAIIELLIPFIVVQVSTNKNLFNKKWIRIIPILAPLIVVLFFGISEYFRSWQYYKYTYDGSFIEFVVYRVMGYYITSVNNAAIYFKYQPISPGKNTLVDIINFPFIGSYFQEAFRDFFPQKDHLKILSEYGTPEFNNLPYIGAILSDFGIVFGSIISFAFGVISNTLYRSFRSRNIIGMIVYPSYYVGLVEISRIYYWVNQRYFPVIILTVLIFIMIISKKSNFQGSGRMNVNS